MRRIGVENMLEVQNLKKVYGNEIKYEALKGINLTVQDGEFIGIMGPSGSGKSTLLNLLATIDSPTDGEILLNGKNPNNLNQEQIAKFRRTELGFVFQNFNLMPTLTVEENIILPLTLDGEKVSVMKRQLAELSERLGINHLLKKRIAEISGGQAQRVAVARAMIHHPQLLLADEPTGNLDPDTAWEIMNLLNNINLRGTTVVVATHAKDIVDKMKKRVIQIDKGIIVRDDKKGGYDSEL